MSFLRNHGSFSQCARSGLALDSPPAPGQHERCRYSYCALIKNGKDVNHIPPRTNSSTSLAMQWHGASSPLSQTPASLPLTSLLPFCLAQSSHTSLSPKAPANMHLSHDLCRKLHDRQARNAKLAARNPRPPGPQGSLDILGEGHLGTFRLALQNVLSTDVAEYAYVQTLDELPARGRSSRGMR